MDLAPYKSHILLLFLLITSLFFISLTEQTAEGDGAAPEVEGEAAPAAEGEGEQQEQQEYASLYLIIQMSEKFSQHC